MMHRARHSGVGLLFAANYTLETGLCYSWPRHTCKIMHVVVDIPPPPPTHIHMVPNGPHNRWSRLLFSVITML